MLLTACATTPAAAPTAAPITASTVTLTLWHSYHTGGSEEKSLTLILSAYSAANPNVTVNVLAIPFDQVYNKWETEVAAGDGPDMVTAPNDNLGKEARASLIAPIDSLVADKLTNYSKTSIDGLSLDGKLYGIPVVAKAVALYYNKSTIPTPPKTTQELMDMVKAGKKIVLYEDAYHNFGFFGAFGGKLADDTGKCILDQAGGTEAMQYLVDLKAAGKANGWDVFQTDGSKIDRLFEQGQADMTIGDPVSLGDYKTNLGDKLGVAPMPAGTAPAAPLSAPDGWFINPNSKNQQTAVDLALFLTNADSQKIFADVAGDPPVRTDVTVADPNVKAFADAFASGFPRPQQAWMDNFWSPFGDMVTKVIEGKSTPADGVKAACAAMSKANNK